jgi:hypothetical protein
MCLKYILVGFIPSIILPLPPCLLLEQFQQVSFFYFHIWIQNTSTIFTLINSFLVPTHWHLPVEKTYFSLLPFILLVQGDFALVLQACIYCDLIKLTPPPVTYSLSITMLP